MPRRIQRCGGEVFLIRNKNVLLSRPAKTYVQNTGAKIEELEPFSPWPAKNGVLVDPGNQR